MTPTRPDLRLKAELAYARTLVLRPLRFAEPAPPGKFRVMPVVAHQTREQFKPGDPNRGATANSPNKFFFAQGPIDAREMPLEFAEEPPSETKLEEQLCLSQNPVRDLLLRGHINPEIRRFVTKYFRYLEDKREDIKADMEGAK